MADFFFGSRYHQRGAISAMSWNVSSGDGNAEDKWSKYKTTLITPCLWTMTMRSTSLTLYQMVVVSHLLPVGMMVVSLALPNLPCTACTVQVFMYLLFLLSLYLIKTEPTLRVSHFI